MTDVCIGIGSNIDAQKNMRQAIGMLQKAFSDIRLSSIYQTAAQDFEDQDDFLNAVARFKTPLNPDVLLIKLQTIEHALHKSPPFKFGPRTLDLDILLYGDQIIQQPNFTIPHPRMHQRRFVLEPLCELIDPTKKHPVLEQTWKELLAETMDQECYNVPSPQGGGKKGLFLSQNSLSFLYGKRHIASSCCFYKRF